MSRNPRILIADDDRSLIAAVQQRLRSAGYQVFTAANAYSALASAARDRPDLLLLDVHIPPGDGFDLHARISKMPRLAATPVVYLTADRSPATANAVSRLGGSALLYKPLGTREILETIEQILTARAA